VGVAAGCRPGLGRDRRGGADLARGGRRGHHPAAHKDELLKLWVRSEVLRLTNIRASQNRKAGNPGPEGSIAKLEFAKVNMDIYEFCVDLLGAAGLVGYDFEMRRAENLGLTGPAGTSRKMFLRARANSIEGGTSEIQRNIIGERVLGLPGEPRTDKDVPWKDVPRS
jgi:alkylation response protein AidB-like acyl-CoA dehydrogenase